MATTKRKAARLADTTIATVAIRDAGAMTPAGRKRIAAWLRAQADALVADGRDYARGFRARYLVPSA